MSIRRTARRLGIPSEASLRFEKGVDISNCDTACRRAVQLLVKYCGVTACVGAVDVYSEPPVPVKVNLRYERVNQILGSNFEPLEIKEVISRLGFGQETIAPGVLQVSIPSYRRDITLEVDLIEEVARIKGFERIPKTMPLNATVGGRSPQQQLLRRFKMLAADCGLNEAVNYSFIHPREADLLRLEAGHPWRHYLAISNPLSEDQSAMRQSLLPGLLHTAARNLARRNLDLRFFETGMVFLPAADYAAQVQPQEILTAAFLLAGRPEESWQENMIILASKALWSGWPRRSAPVGSISRHAGRNISIPDAAPLYCWTACRSA